MKNKLQKIIKHIKMMFYNLSLCVSLKKDTNTTEKDLCEKDKCGKFEDNFDYGEIIEKYYNGDKQKFMTEKDEYKKDIENLKQLIKDAKLGVLSYSDFNEIKRLLIKLGEFTNEEYDNFIKNNGFSFDKLYEYIVDRDNMDKSERIKGSGILGSLSGTTMNVEYKFVKKYDEFIKKVKK